MSLRDQKAAVARRAGGDSSSARDHLMVEVRVELQFHVNKATSSRVPLLSHMTWKG